MKDAVCLGYPIVIRHLIRSAQLALDPGGGTGGLREVDDLLRKMEELTDDYIQHIPQRAPVGGERFSWLEDAEGLVQSERSSGDGSARSKLLRQLVSAGNDAERVPGLHDPEVHRQIEGVQRDLGAGE